MSAACFEMVAGLETHVELKTDTKIFCGCPTGFGAAPNTQCCPVCSGLPGALPVLNRRAVELAVTAGLALNCEISERSQMARKNYFYPDLPKAYQITQLEPPLCENGWLEISTPRGSKRIHIARIHMEEDAGKLIHQEDGTLVDFNRCGVPLIEIVTEPDFRSAVEIREYLQKLRSVLLFAGVTDGRMNEGSIRCDVNLSVRKKGASALGVRTEMKNLNSFQFIEKAADYEFKRQAGLLKNGEPVLRETRRYDAKTGCTETMRVKEEAEDYRFFPEPDLPPITISKSWIKRLKEELPPLPDQRRQRYEACYGLSPYSAKQLTLSPTIADYFEAAAANTRYPQLAANLILTEILRLLPVETDSIPVAPERLGTLSDLFGDGRVNSSACKEILAALWGQDAEPEALMEQNGLEQIGDEEILGALAAEIILEQPRMAKDYQQGKKAALQALVGQMMKKTKGRADPEKAKRAFSGLLL